MHKSIGAKVGNKHEHGGKQTNNEHSCVLTKKDGRHTKAVTYEIRKMQ